MKSRDLIKEALEHRETVKIPFDLGATTVTGIHVDAYIKLRNILGLQNTVPPKVFDPFQMLALVEMDIIKLLNIDTIGLRLPYTLFGFKNTKWKEWELFDGTKVLVSENFVASKNNRGDVLLYPQGDINAPPSAKMPKNGHYFDLINRQQEIFNFDNVKEADLDPVQWVREQFSVYTDEDLEYMKRKAIQLHENTDLAVVYGSGVGEFGNMAFVPGPNVKFPSGIRNPEDWFLAHIRFPEYIYNIFDEQCKIGLKNLRLLYKAVGNNIDVIYVGGKDLGTQMGPYIKPSMFRELYKPFIKILNDWIHKNTKWKTMFHSCGSVVQFMEDFIDAGIDIINPVQCSAKGMDPEKLKKEYGDRLVFWGGGVDTQKILPFGTPEDVKEQIKQRIEIFAPDGGYVFNPVHNIQPGVTVENLEAMLEAINNYR